MKKGINLGGFKSIFLFILLGIFIIVVTSPFMVFYGPFKNIRNLVIDRSLNSTSHKYIAKFFLSEKEVQAFYESRDNKNFDKQQISNSDDFKNDDKNLVEMEEIVTNKSFKAYMLIVHDPKKVKVGYAKEIGKVGEKTSSIAKRNKAIAAINGGGFFFEPYNKLVGTSIGDKPMGFIISEGKVIYDQNEDIERDVMAFDDKGVLIVGKHTLADLKNLNVKEAICFGPALVVNGKAQKNEEIGVAMAQRTAIGQKKDGTVLMLVTNNGDANNRNFLNGATFKDLEDIMIKYEAETAVNLDGGGSSNMYYNGENIGNQYLFLGERTVPSIVYVK